MDYRIKEVFFMTITALIIFAMNVSAKIAFASASQPIGGVAAAVNVLVSIVVTVCVLKLAFKFAPKKQYDFVDGVIESQENVFICKKTFFFDDGRIVKKINLKSSCFIIIAETILAVKLFVMV